MTRTRLLRACTMLTVATLAWSTAATPAEAGQRDRSATGARHRLGPVADLPYDAMTLSTRGVVVAVWMSGDPNGDLSHRVHAAVRRPGHAWSATRLVGRAAHDSRPELVSLSHGRVTAAWENAAGDTIVRQWRPGTGWRSATLWPGHGTPLLASDPAARTWAVAAVQPVGTSGAELDVVVHSRGVTRHTVLATTSCPSYLRGLAVGDRGDVAATWVNGHQACADQPQPEASHLGLRTTVWTTQDLGGCPSFCSDLDPFAAASRLVIKRVDTAVAGTRTVTFWDLGNHGEWTQEPGDQPPVVGDVVSNARGDLLSCLREQHAKLWVRRVGHPWKQVTLPDFRVNACTLDDHGRVVGIGNTTVGAHHLALTWGTLRQSRFTKVRTFRTRPYDGHDDNFSQVVLASHGVVTGLVTMTRDARRIDVAIRARVSAFASRGPAG